MAISIVVYEVLAAIFTTFRGWQALRIRVDLTSGMNRLQYLVVQQGILYFCFVSIFTMSTLIMLHIAPSGSFLQRLFNGLTLPISGIMTARFILHLREWDHKVTTASEGSVMEPIEFQQPSPESEGSEQDHEDESEYVNEREREHERSRSRSGSGSIIDEFGRCPVRQARIERKLSIQNDIEEV
ncbi:hypothetical protein CVT25_010690 [Psilocybe cyanescens]|uniref:Uncharacterized protein n=1 Tax=Psilocybe cyanescens TaxID=93625 RepID=A0A409WK24_PSICY|nr:hypothetical protein CVT25_010690 [Psilocybe cyanescens]